MRVGCSGSRTPLSKSITASNAPPSLIQAFTACRTASRAGVQAPTRKVSCSNGVSVQPKILMPRACARSAICFRPAIICSAVTSSSGFAQRLRRSLVPSITIACVTPGCASTSRSKRRRPLSPRMSCRMRLPPRPWFITPIARPRVRRAVAQAGPASGRTHRGWRCSRRSANRRAPRCRRSPPAPARRCR